MAITVACVRPFTLAEVPVLGAVQYESDAPALPLTTTFVGGDFHATYSVALSSDVSTLTVGGAKIVLDGSTAQIQDSTSTMKASGAAVGTSFDVDVTMAGTVMTVKVADATVATFDWTGTTGFPIDSGSFVWSTSGAGTVTLVKVYQGYLLVFDPFLRDAGPIGTSPEGYPYSAFGSHALPAVDANGVRNATTADWGFQLAESAGIPPDDLFDWTYQFYPGTSSEVKFCVKVKDANNYVYADVGGSSILHKVVAGVDTVEVSNAASATAGQYNSIRFTNTRYPGSPNDCWVMLNGNWLFDIDITGLDGYGVAVVQAETDGFGSLLAQSAAIPATAMLGHTSYTETGVATSTHSFTLPVESQGIVIGVARADGSEIAPTVTFAGVDVPQFNEQEGGTFCELALFTMPSGPRTGDIVVTYGSAPAAFSVIAMALNGRLVTLYGDGSSSSDAGPGGLLAIFVHGQPAVTDIEFLLAVFHSPSGVLTPPTSPPAPAWATVETQQLNANYTFLLQQATPNTDSSSVYEWSWADGGGACANASFVAAVA